MTLTSVPKSLRTNGSVDIGSETDANNCTDQNAALRVSGGAAIGKSLHVCERGTFNSTNNINSISSGGGTPSGFFGGGVHVGKDLYVGDDLWVQDQLQVNDRALVETHIRIGGDSNLSGHYPSSNLLGGVLDQGLQPSVDASDSGGFGVGIGCKTHAFAEAHIGRIMIGYYDSNSPTTSGNQTITTRSGELKLSAEQGSSGSKIEANSRFEVTVTDNSTSTSTGALRVEGGVGIKKDVFVGGDLETAFVRIDGRTIEPKSGNLSIGSNSSNTQVKGDISVASAANFAGNTVQITSNKVKAATFEGTVDIAETANKAKVFGPGSGGGEGYMMVVDGAGPSKNLEMHTNARFNGSTFSISNSDITQTNPSQFVKLIGTNGNIETTGNIDIDGNVNCNQVRAAGDIFAFLSSDERLKDNISKIEDPLAKVVSLGGYTFDWNEKSDNDGTETGVIAQEVESLGLPGIVTTRNNGYKAVRYEKLVPLLIEAIKELNDKVSSLEDKLNN
jgi:hypothetical protein